MAPFGSQALKKRMDSTIIIIIVVYIDGDILSNIIREAFNKKKTGNSVTLSKKVGGGLIKNQIS